MDRASRTVHLARMGARTGTDYVAMRARSALSSDERRGELEAQFHLRSAEQVAEMLGGMKGALMKLGQMASYLDQGLPEPVREALAQLQSDAPPMAPELVEQVIRAELGDAPERVFARWDPVPLAAASIGQVHAAVTHDGLAVAVKVQYPGVDRAVASDLENTDLLFNVMGMLFPGMDPKPIVAELRERLVEELDYRIEADHQQRLRRLLRRAPLHPRPGRGGRPVHRPGPDHGAGRGGELRRGGAVARRGAPAHRGDAVPVRVRQHLPAARLQRGPAPRQLPVPARAARSRSWTSACASGSPTTR